MWTLLKFIRTDVGGGGRETWPLERHGDRRLLAFGDLDLLLWVTGGLPGSVGRNVFF